MNVTQAIKQEGLQQGMQQGMQQGLEKAAKNMLSNLHLDMDVVQKATGLSIESLKRIQAGLD